MGYAFTNVATQSVIPEELSGQASGVSLTLMVTIAGVAVVLGAMVVGLAFGWAQRHETIARVSVSS